MNKSYQAIAAAVRSVRRRRRLLLGLRTTFWAVAVLLASLLLAVVILPQVGGVFRLALRLFLLVAFFGAILFGIIRIILQRESEETTALIIEQENPGLHNALISSLQLSRALEKSGPASAFSLAFFTRHLESTAALLNKLDLKKPAPFSSLKRPGQVVLFIFLLLLLSLVVAPGRSRSGLIALFQEPWQVTRASGLSTALPLTTGDFDLYYSFPLYSELPDQTISHTNGDLAGLKGTLVRISTRTLEPLTSASLVTSWGERLAVKVKNKTQLEVDLVLSVAGTYHLEGVDTEGERRAESRSHRVVVDEDLPPKMVMLIPVSDVQASAEGSLALSYEASDDFGLRELAVVFLRNNVENKVVIRTWTENGVKQTQDQYEWKLANLNLQPGEKIPFYLQATDNDEVSGGKVGKSETRLLEIFSARKNHQAVLARQDELLNMMIDHLASSLEAWLKDKDGTTNPLLTETPLINEAMSLVSMLQAVLLELLNDEMAEPVVVDALTEMESRYSARLAERQKLIAGKTQLSAAEQKTLLSLREDYRAELEKDILFLDKLIKKQRMDDLLTEADELAKAKAQLADLMEQFRRTGDPALLLQLQEAMADLQSRWDSLLRRMAELRGSLPEEFINADALESKNVSDLAEQMEKLRQALNDGDMETAMKIADQLFGDMNKWMSGLEESAEKTGELMSREMMQKLEGLQNRLSDLIQRQKEIEDRTQEIYERGLSRNQRSQPSKKTLDELNQLISDFEEATIQARNALYRLEPGASQGKARPLTAALNETRNALVSSYSLLRREARKIPEMVSQGQTEASLAQAKDMKQRLETTVDESRRMIAENQMGPAEPKEKHDAAAGSALELIKKIIELLTRLDQANQFSLTEEEVQELQQLAAEEQAIKQEAEAALNDYEQMRSEAPSLPKSVSEHLDQATGKCQSAAEEMMMGDPSRALTPSREARMHLEQANKKLNQSQQQMGQCMGGRAGKSGQAQGVRPGQKKGGGQGLSSTEKVEIPDPNAHKGPEQYRKDVLKAMKEPGPEQYQNLNRDYYQRLIK